MTIIGSWDSTNLHVKLVYVLVLLMLQVLVVGTKDSCKCQYGCRTNTHRVGREGEKKMASLLVLEMRAVAIGDNSMPSLGTMRGSVNDDERNPKISKQNLRCLPPFSI